MPELEEIDVYDIKIAGVFRVNASSSTDAINKAKEWIESNAGKLDYTWTLQKVHIEPEGE